uniref:Uncharacterized protein n=1 Tax=Seriola lalandi dorsalis TaxID=1841481 RepID=A0A3B4YRN2_SERLL
MCLSCVDHPSLKPNAALNSGLFGDDVDCHDRLTVLVFGFTDVVPKVNGLHVLYSHDTLGDPCGVDVNRTVVLHNKTNMASVIVLIFFFFSNAAGDS